MEKDVKIHPVSENQPCHWCKAGFVYVADQALGTGSTVLCNDHSQIFMATFRVPEAESQDGI